MKELTMPFWNRTELVWRSSRLRLQHSRNSLATSNALLRQADLRIERGRNRRTQQLVPCLPEVARASLNGMQAAQEWVSAECHDQYEVVRDRVIDGEVVQLDGKHFVECLLQNCTLEYDGQAVIFESTRFSGCRFRFSGYAAMTMQFLECFGIVAESAPEYTTVPRSTTLPRRVN